MILARTIKGKGVALIEGKDGWHGKAFKKGEEMDRALAELEAQFVPTTDWRRLLRDSEAGAAQVRRRRRLRAKLIPRPPTSSATASPRARPTARRSPRSAKLDARIVALDADVKNSTFSDKFEKVAPDRFYEIFIAEQVMIGAAMGLAAAARFRFRRRSPASSTRAARLHPHGGDLQRRASRWPGSHAGISIGEDGPSQMALEDLAMCRGAAELHRALSVRGRERRAAGGARRGDDRARRTSARAGRRRRSSTARRDVRRRRARRCCARARSDVGDGRRRRRDALRGAQGARPAAKASGIAIRVIDLLFGRSRSTRTALVAAGEATGGRIITVEDHYAAGGLGDAVSEAVGDAGSRCTGSRCARFRAAASPRSCSIVSASRRSTSSRPCGRSRRRASFRGCTLRRRP